MPSSYLRIAFLGVALAVFGPGCGGTSGPPLGTVTGTVTLGGEPLAGVKVTFVPQEKGSPSYGATDENGVYRLFFNQKRVGAELGTHHVLIETRELETDDSGKPIDDTPIVKIPVKYQQPGQLTADVDSGRNEIDFDLEAETKQSPNATRTASK